MPASLIPHGLVFGGVVEFDTETIVLILLYVAVVSFIACVVPPLIVATIVSIVTPRTTERKIFWRTFGITLVLWVPILWVIVAAS